MYCVISKNIPQDIVITQEGNKMLCPYCNNEETKVMDKRDNDAVTRRRRECLKCGKRFTTFERIEMNLYVLKKDGSKEKFNREKLKSGVFKCLEKRNFNSDEIENILNKIEAKIYKYAKDKDIETKKIGEIVMSELKKVDKVSYIRFAAVYKGFDTLDDFEAELKEIKNGN
jgi:transcriptional repressor NrdR